MGVSQGPGIKIVSMRAISFFFWIGHIILISIQFRLWKMYANKSHMRQPSYWFGAGVWIDPQIQQLMGP